MPIELLPGEVVIPDREALVERWKRSHRTRVPGADTGPGTQPDVDARVAVDAVLPILVAAKIAGRNAVLEESIGAAVDQWGVREGVPDRRGAVGASGFVTISTSVGGTTIQNGDQLIYESTGLRYQAIGTAPYVSGQLVPVVGVDFGPDTNVAAGSAIKWASPRPGCFDTAIVFEQSDGSGLTGGRGDESDEEYKSRILEEKRTRAASGNDSEYQLAVESTPSVAIQKAFTIPGIMGPGTIAVLFTMRPSRSGGSRIPNAAQVALVETHVADQFPADDGSFFCLLTNEPTDITYSITWAEQTQGWEDLVAWPPFYELGASPGGIVVKSATSATSFQLGAANGIDLTAQQPQVGQTIGFYDQASFVFRRKRILSITGTGPWTIVADTTNGVSDVLYTPVVGQRAMPWSDSLDSLLPGIHAYFDTLGPGEQVVVFYDEGRRQKRIPLSPRSWPSRLTAKGLTNAVDIDQVEDVAILEGEDRATPIGVPGVFSNILFLRFLSVFPEQQ